MNVTELVKEIHQAAKDKGFWDQERNVGEMLMLVVSELGEAIEAHRKGRMFNGENLIVVGADAEVAWFGAHVKDTFEDEIADAVIRLMDMAGGLGIDLEWHINAKLAYNKTRARLHGKAY